MMHQITLKLQFITPCFCSGADQNQAELRPQSIAGQLRWWHRVLNGGADLKKESQLFGSAGDEGRSRLQIRTRITKPRECRESWLTALATSERNKKTHEKHKLLGYFWFFLDKQGRIENRAFLPEGTEFELILRSRDEEALRQGMRVAMLWASLGALGSRSTRAAGSTTLKQIEIGSVSDTFAEEIQSLATQNTATSLTRHLWGESMPPYEIWRFNKTMSGEQAVKWLSDRWYCLRAYGYKGKRPECGSAENLGELDHRDAATLFGSKAQSKPYVRRAVLGLPYRQKEPGGRNYLEWHFPEKDGVSPKIQRLTSPVMLRVFPAKNGCYPGAIIFRSIFHKESMQTVFDNEMIAGRNKLPVDKEIAFDKLQELFTERLV
jgi:CRISPR type III-B/RAMP module RAMP protein Cmr1